MAVQLGRPVDGERLARQGREVDLQPPFQKPRVGRDLVAGLQQEDVARDELAGFDLAAAPVPEDRGALGQVALERFHGALGLPLLGEGEEGVQHDHRDDRDGEDRQLPDEGENCGEPQQEREWVRELPDKVVPPTAPPLRRSSFGPNSTSRRFASRAESPVGAARRSRRSISAGSRGSPFRIGDTGGSSAVISLRRSRVRARAASGPGTSGRAAFPQAGGGLPTDGAGRAHARSSET